MKAQILGLLLLGLFGLQNVSAQITWEQKANKPTKNMCNGVFFNGKIYVSYENSQKHICIEEYDPATNTWKAKKGVSHSINGGVYCFVATTSGMYVLGGYSGGNPSNKVEEYNPVLDTFLIKKDMPFAVDCSTASAVNGKIYLIGGVLPNASSGNNKTYEYDPSAETWTAKKNAPRPRSEHYSISVDNKIYTWGGFTTNGSGNYIDIYDPSTDTWITGTQCIIPDRWGYGMGYAKGALYFMLGTFGTNLYLLTEEIYSFDIKNNTVTKIGNNKKPKWQKAVVSLNDSIYMIGGLSGTFPDGPVYNTTEMFTPSSITGIGVIPDDSKKIPVSIRYNTSTRGIVVSCNEQKIHSGDITVTGIDGKIWYINKHLNLSTPTEIQTGNLPTGIYIVSVSSDRVTTTHKFILN